LGWYFKTGTFYFHRLLKSHGRCILGIGDNRRIYHLPSFHFFFLDILDGIDFYIQVIDVYWNSFQGDCYYQPVGFQTIATYIDAGFEIEELVHFLSLFIS